MTPETQKIVEKIRKLQALATSDNVNEAAAAAAQAQKLIERHKIEAHLLRDVQEASSDGPMVDRVIYTFEGPMCATWVLSLSAGVCAAQGVKTYYRQAGKSSPGDEVCPVCGVGPGEECEQDEELTNPNAKYHSPRFKLAREKWRERYKDGAKGKIFGVGTEGDVELAELMLTSLASQVNALHDKLAPKGNDNAAAKDWGMSFRNGAVVSIIERVEKARAELRKQMADEARVKDHAAKGGTFALAVQTAIAAVDQRFAKAEEFAEKKHKLKKGGKRTSGQSMEGWCSGREAGKRVDIDGAKRRRITEK